MGNDTDFLRAMLSESQEEMRWRREVEYKLLTLQVSVIALLISAQAFIYKEAVPISSQLAIAGSIILFLTLLTGSMTWKICAEHAIYEVIGRQVVKLWDYFGMFEPGIYSEDAILPSEARAYGQGSGYKKTIAILWLVTVGGVVASILLALVV